MNNVTDETIRSLLIVYKGDTAKVLKQVTIGMERGVAYSILKAQVVRLADEFSTRQLVSNPAATNKIAALGRIALRDIGDALNDSADDPAVRRRLMDIMRIVARMTALAIEDDDD